MVGEGVQTRTRTTKFAFSRSNLSMSTSGPDMLFACIEANRLQCSSVSPRSEGASETSTQQQGGDHIVEALHLGTANFKR